MLKSPIFTIFGILVNNDKTDMSHEFGCHGHYFGKKVCVTIVNWEYVRLKITLQACTYPRDRGRDVFYLLYFPFPVLKLGVTILWNWELPVSQNSYHSLKLADKLMHKGIMFFHYFNLYLCHYTLMTCRYTIDDTFLFKTPKNIKST